MTPQHVISQLLDSDIKHKNLDLLKKIILVSYFGRLHINGVSPSNQIALGSYLFDHEQLMFDFTRLSEKKREQLEQWLLNDHQQEKEKNYFSGLSVNEYRGFTAEVQLSWWDRLMRWMQGEYSEHWKIADLDLLSLSYQLLGIDLTHGQQGILVGFRQFLVPPSGAKYKDPDELQAEPMGNTKRVFITDALVDKLTKINLNALKFEAVCKKPHPLSIDAGHPEIRYQNMRDYRSIHQYNPEQPWYSQLWDWVVSWFKSAVEPEQAIKKEQKKFDYSLRLLYENDTVTVYQRNSSQEILVKEKRPNIENLVFCGGGAKIFGHVGVWKALNEMQIRPQKFAGSSAGAIMALLCYLGFDADEIAELFKYFRQEHLVYFDIDSKGLSDSDAIKTALDYAIALKIKKIVSKYNVPYPRGKITFATLEALRVRCPDCGIGAELIVTTTNKRLRKTTYFSFGKTPDMEVSEVVRTSASFPIIYRHNLINGEEHNDGGVLSNFPTEAFPDDGSTFLESEYGNNMKTLAVQFDNGIERTIVDRAMDRVYRENFILNWIYAFLTGVKDPVSAWEQDRMKLRQYSGQSIIVDIGATSSTGFSVEDEHQALLIRNGYVAAKDYLSARYAKKEGAPYKNKEMMHALFSSLGELLAYCCYKGDRAWFEVVSKLIADSSLENKSALIKQSRKLKALYFSREHVSDELSQSMTFFGHDLVQQSTTDRAANKNHEVLLALYPIFLKLSSSLLRNNEDKKLLEAARHSFTAATPFKCLNYFARINDDVHILLHIFINLVRDLKNERTTDTYEALKLVQQLLYTHKDLLNPDYYSPWDLNTRQGRKVLQLLSSDAPSAATFIASLGKQPELVQDEEPVEEEYCDSQAPVNSLNVSQFR